MTTEGKPNRKEIRDDDASNDHRDGGNDGASPAAQPGRAGGPADSGDVPAGRGDDRDRGPERLRQTGDLDGALAVFAGADTGKATAQQSRWAHAEWLDLVKRKFGERELALYSQGKGAPRSA